MAEKIAEKIRKMAEIVDEEHIARAVGVPLEIVKGVLSGEIPDEALDDFDPARPPDVRLVEKKKFVRSKLVGVFSTGGCGATTLTAVLAALSTGTAPAAAVDLNEFSHLGQVLGLDVTGEKAVLYPNVSWWGSSETGDIIVRHPALNALNLVIGAATAERYLELKPDVVVSGLKDLSGMFPVTWVDGPSYPGFWKSVMPALDLIIFVLRPDPASLTSFWQGYPLMEAWSAGAGIVLNYEAERSLPAAECRRTLRRFTDIPVVAVLPEDPVIRQAALEGRCVPLNSEFASAAGAVLEAVLPGANIKKKRGVLEAIAGMFARKETIC